MRSYRSFAQYPPKYFNGKKGTLIQENGWGKVGGEGGAGLAINQPETVSYSRLWK